MLQNMIAIVSDIHGNLEALQAVLADIKQQGATEIICLGDLIGYGPDPVPCVELAMKWSVCLRGNHEDAALSKDDLPGWGSRIAAETIFRFRREVLKHQKLQTIYPFLESLPISVKSPEALYVHGSPREPTHEYVFPEDIYNEKKLTAIFARFSGLCFCGHTHLPGVFHREASWNHLSAEECGNELTRDASQLLVNVGSVGQPRDGDPRACYVLFGGDTIRFRRVEYDMQRTIEKLKKLDPP
jgi:diadenosine tetraphosphatase ApaH/serine/threonine PP2A family protein phosphatase